MPPTSFLLPRRMSALVEESSSAAAVEAPTLPAACSLCLSAVDMAPSTKRSPNVAGLQRCIMVKLAQMLLTCASKNQNHLPVSAGALNAAGISAGVLSGMLGILLLLLSPHVAPAMP